MGIRLWCAARMFISLLPTEGTRSICDDIGEGFMMVYMEGDKNFVKAEKTACLSIGFNYRGQTFWYKK
jgi:hypothetical protein